MKFLRCNPIHKTLFFKRLSLVAFALFVLTACSEVEWERSQRANEANEQGVSALQAGNISEAQRQFMESLEHEPSEGAFHLNLGYSFEVARKPDEALKAYEGVVALSDNPQIDFFAHFNTGRIYGEAKEYEKAFAAYQAALGTNPPDDLAKEVKTNIELLAQKQQQEQQQKQDQGEGEENKEDSEGEGEQKKDQEKQDQEKKDQSGKQKDQKQDKKYSDPRDQKPQKKPFDSKELTEHDVRRIFEELTRQEQKIRAEFNKDDAKETPGEEKDW